MAYKINLGAWQGVFAVPNEVVDKHIKIASAAHLKVLLWILRSGKDFDADEISKELGMHIADVRDCLQFWVQEAKILQITDGVISPSSEAKEADLFTASAAPTESPKKELKPEKPKDTRAVSRPQRPDSFHVAKRISENPSLGGLVSEAEVVLGRTLSGGDLSTLVMMHDNDGLPPEVILMILQYAVGQGKNSMRYIEKIGINWSSEDINTVEHAEEQIKKLNLNKDAWGNVARTFGLSTSGSPTEFQRDCANRWLIQWKYGLTMIRLAYEKCVDQKGEYNLRYIDGIIKKWHKEGIFTESDLEAFEQQHTKTKTKNTKPKDQRNASYDLTGLEEMLNEFD